MAIDPQELATEQTQRAALDQKGAPTEFASDPADAVQLAGGGAGALMAVLNRFAKNVEPVETNKPTQSTATRVPTEQERVQLPDDGTFSERATQRALAPQVLSPEGQAKFEKQGFKAQSGTVLQQAQDGQVLQDAQSAIQQQAEQSPISVEELARKALIQEKQGKAPGPESATIADEGEADAVLEAITARDAQIKSLQDGGDFNFNNINSTDDVLATITALSEQYKGPISEAKRKYVPNESTVQSAANLLVDEIGLTQEILARQTGQTFNAEMLVAARELMVRNADQLQTLAAKINRGAATDADRLQFRRGLAIQAGIQLQLKGAQTEAARALQSFNIPVGDDKIRLDLEAQRLIQAAGGPGMTDELAEGYLDVVKNDGLAGANRFSQGGWRATTRQMLSEALLAGYLSNPASQIRNIGGALAFMAFQLPGELIAGMYGAVIRQGRQQLGMAYPISRDQAYMDDPMFRIKGYLDSYRDALRVAKVAFKSEKPAGSSKVDLEQYTSIQGGSNTPTARAITELGKRIRLPFRLLLGADEFFKTISQRGELYVQVNQTYKNAIREGKSITEAQDEAAMLLLDPKAVATELDNKAKFDTLQSDLGEIGRVIGRFQRFDIFGIPIGRSIIPFMTAPTNAIIRSAEFTPILNLITPNGAADIIGRNGARAQQLAMGRVSIGATTIALFAHQAEQGRLTGSLPSDPQEREMLPPNWKPYSMVFRDKGFPEGLPLYDAFGRPNGPLLYVSYAGFEPVGALIGITADTVQRMRRTRDPEMRNNLGMAAVLATQNYFKELPMLQGIADVSDALENLDPSYAFSGLAGATSIVAVPNPLSALQRAADRARDPGMVTPRGDMEYYTLDDVMQTDEEGNYIYAKTDGSPEYRLVGRPKSEGLDPVISFFSKLGAMQAQGSMFRDEEETNAIRYDSLGIQIGSADTSIAVNPVLAITNNFSGIRLDPAKMPEDYQLELMRLSTIEGKWPLTNPDRKGGVRLSRGAQSDLVNLAKNEVRLGSILRGRKTFREALKDMLTTPGNVYDRIGSDKERVGLVRSLNNQYLDAGFEELLKDPRYENLRQAVTDLENLPD